MKDFSNMVGFTIDGVHCSQMGCAYIYTEDEFEHNYGRFKTNEVAVPNRMGSYSLPTTLEEKEFRLPLLFEGLTEREYTNLLNWIRPEHEEKELVFDRKKAIKYRVKLAKEPNIKTYEIQSGYCGKITYELLCCDGYGVLDYEVIANHDVVLSDFVETCPFSVNQNDFFNRGDYATGAKIEFTTTDKDEITFTNTKNNSRCKLIGLNKLGAGKKVVIDSDNGRTLVDGKIDFSIHDYGYITLESSKYLGKISVNVLDGKRIVVSDKKAKVGMFLKPAGVSKPILIIGTEDNKELQTPVSGTGIQTMDLVDMNRIVNDAELVHFDVSGIERVR